MRALSAIVGLVRRHARAYAAMCLAYYGLAVAAMIAVGIAPGLETALRSGVKSSFNSQLLAAYARGDVLPAAGLTFANNVLLAALLAMIVPSLVVPFWGVAIGAARAVLWGLALSPADPAYAGRFVAQFPTWLLEGQAYVLAMLAVVLLWNGVLWPGRAGLGSWREGYGVGLRQTVTLFVGTTALLAVAALYEALADIYLVPALGLAR